MTLANGKAPVIGRVAIAEQATWLPSQYQFTWTPEGGRMSEAGDMGFTWGHYEGDVEGSERQSHRYQRPLLYGLEAAIGRHMEGGS